jgi:hypothetical protein
MAQFTFLWGNTDVLASSNATGQRASYRQKTVGGTWLTSGFTPTNDLTKSAVTVQSPVVTNNVVYEFKLECLCTQNGPTSNDNGIIEQIGFSCITPNLVNTSTTSTATIDLTNTDITKISFELRKASDNSLVFGPVIVARIGNSAQAVAAGLTASTNYYWKTSLIATVNGVEVNSSGTGYINSLCGPFNFTTSVAPTQNLIWIAQNTVCETEGGFGIVRTISSLSSPGRSWYDSVNQLVYVADFDDALGNVYWFNPNTATSSSDLTHSTVVNDNLLYNNYIDTVNRKIYFVGANSNGLVVYDIATNTKSTVAFGTNGTFSRVMLSVTTNYIYCNDGSTSIIRINRSSLTIDATLFISGLNTPAHFTPDTVLIEANSKLYVLNNNNGGIGTIGVYNTSLSSHITEIALPGATPWVGGNNAYWQTGFFDVASNKLYVGDIGSSSRYIIDVNTDTVIDTKTITNKGGKSNAQASWTINPTTNDLMFLVTMLNSIIDTTPIKRAYREDRVTHNYIRMYATQSYSGLTGVAGTNKTVGVNPGQVFWNGNPSYNTDGSIQILDTSIGANKTGLKIVTTLQQVDANNGNAPTGLTKPNIPSDANYIQPSTDLTSCPIITNLDCPVDLVTSFNGATLFYEFSIANTVKNNSTIKKIQVFAFNTNTASIEGSPIEISSPFSTNYYSGSFGSLGGSNYTIQVKYLDISNVVLKTC